MRRIVILLVEDNPDDAELTRMAIEDQKIDNELVIATDGLEAVEWYFGQGEFAERDLEDTTPILLLDINLPKINGFDVCRRIRAQETDHPPYILMLTTAGEKGDIVKGLGVGADDYLSKPFDAEELRARIEVGRRIIRMQAQMAEEVKQLRAALAHVKTLQGILPICAFCKKIRDDDDYWRQVEEYVGSHSDAVFSHAICPECLKKHYPEYAQSAAEEASSAETNHPSATSALRSTD